MTDEALEQYERDQDTFLRRVRNLERTNDDHEREALAAISDLAACHKYLSVFARCVVLATITASVLAVAVLLLTLIYVFHGH